MSDTGVWRSRPRIVVVGIGADGWAGVPARLREVVLAADVVLGGGRQLALLPDVPGQERTAWPSPLRPALPALLQRYAGRRAVVLASGDPMMCGIGSTLVDLLGPDAVALEPAVSSVALARGRLGWPAERTDVVSLVGRDAHRVLRHLAPGHQVLVLSEGSHTPAEVARLLADAGYGASAITVLGDLGSPAETRLDGTADDWAVRAPEGVPRLHVLGLALVGPVLAGWVAGLPDGAFEHDGQLTKRDIRASALARLAPQPGQLLWDVGAGAGSVAIEWMRAHPTCAAVAVEADRARVDRIGRNAARLGVPGLQVVDGRAPDALCALPPPDAVFVGGGATQSGVLQTCLAALRPRGRLVVHAVTVETEAVLGRMHAEHGGELTRIAVEHAAPVGAFIGWTPARTVTQWAVVR